MSAQARQEACQPPGYCILQYCLQRSCTSSLLSMYTMNILSAAGLKIRNTSLYRYEKQITKMFDEETGKEYHRIVDIRQEAVYSRNSLTEEQKQEMMEFKEKIWKRIYANGTWIQKMQLKYIYFL